MSKDVLKPILKGIGLSMASLAIAQQVLAQTANFSDVQGYWGEPYVTTLAGRQIIGGFPDGSFQPNALITRAQFAAIAAKALSLNTSSGGRNTFVDVPSGYWAAPAITAVSNSGLVTGFPDSTFRPEDKITRAQALVILAKALNSTNTNPSALNRYTDVQSIPQWATDSVAKAANANIIVNFPTANRIDPNNLATRGEVAALMYQALSRLGTNLPPVSIGLIDGNNTGTGNNNFPPVGTGNLTLERVGLNNDQRPYLVAGDELVVRAFGTSRANANFSIENVISNVPMTEVQNGMYEGRYTVRRNDNQNNAKVTVSLSLPNNSTSISQVASRNMTIAGSNNNLPSTGTGSLSIQRISLNVGQKQYLVGGDELVVKATGTPRANASFTIENVVDNVQMTETQNGAYEGRYTVRRNDNQNNARVIVALSLPNTTPITQLARRTITITGSGTAANNTGNNNGSQTSLFPQIVNLANNSVISLPQQIVGRTVPNARVQVKADALSTIAGLVGIAQPLLNGTVQADNLGNFAFNLEPAGFNLASGTRYRITLTATDPQTNTTQTNELSLTQR